MHCLGPASTKCVCSKALLPVRLSKLPHAPAGIARVRHVSHTGALALCLHQCCSVPVGLRPLLLAVMVPAAAGHPGGVLLDEEPDGGSPPSSPQGGDIQGAARGQDTPCALRPAKVDGHLEHPQGRPCTSLSACIRLGLGGRCQAPIWQEAVPAVLHAGTQHLSWLRRECPPARQHQALQAYRHATQAAWLPCCAPSVLASSPSECSLPCCPPQLCTRMRLHTCSASPCRCLLQWPAQPQRPASSRCWRPRAWPRSWRLW